MDEIARKHLHILQNTFIINPFTLIIAYQTKERKESFARDTTRCQMPFPHLARVAPFRPGAEHVLGDAEGDGVGTGDLGGTGEPIHHGHGRLLQDTSHLSHP